MRLPLYCQYVPWLSFSSFSFSDIASDSLCLFRLGVSIKPAMLNKLNRKLLVAFLAPDSSLLTQLTHLSITLLSISLTIWKKVPSRIIGKFYLPPSCEQYQTTTQT